MIEQAVYMEDGGINAFIDGVQLSIPDDPANRHRRMLAEWEARGNSIAPYVEPTPSASDHTLNRFQFEVMLDALGITPAEVEIAINSTQATRREKVILKSRLRNTAEFHRGNPLLGLLSQYATEAEVDVAWMDAKDLR